MISYQALVCKWKAHIANFNVHFKYLTKLTFSLVIICSFINYSLKNYKNYWIIKMLQKITFKLDKSIHILKASKLK